MQGFANQDYFGSDSDDSQVDDAQDFAFADSFLPMDENIHELDAKSSLSSSTPAVAWGQLNGAGNDQLDSTMNKRIDMISEAGAHIATSFCSIISGYSLYIAFCISYWQRSLGRVLVC